LSAGDRYAYKDFITLTDEEVEKIIHQRTSSGRLLGGDQSMELLDRRVGCTLKIGRRGRPRKQEK
jgi:hypothetical protein